MPYSAGYLTARIRNEELIVFTYRPILDNVFGILFVFDGLNRDASGMRDKAIPLAERAGLLIFAPLMDRKRFPKWRYNSAGVVRHGQEQSREFWTGPQLQMLFEWARDMVDQPSAPIFLFGHSAGGQMLSRICAYSPLSGIERIVIANPSSHVAPLHEEPAPFGFQNIFSPPEVLRRLQVYLGLPITIYLGQEDTGDRHLDKSDAAMRQGTNRLERGRSVYEAALEVAREHAWAFHWHLVEVPETGHSARGMLNALQCSDALGLNLEDASKPGLIKPL
jgi:hypothetical protein